LFKGERFTSDEAADIFFGVTKLFQSQGWIGFFDFSELLSADPHLRRMVYLVIKELAVESV
jgi:hypothetical protein